MPRVTSGHIVYKIRSGGTASSDVGSSVGPSRDVWPTSGLVEQLHRTSGHLSGHRETSGRRQAWWNSFIGRRVICRAIERRLADVRPGVTASSDVGSSVGPSRDVWPTSGLAEQLHRTSGHLSGHRETSGRRQAWWNSFIGRRVICRAIERRLADVRPGGTASSDVGSSVGPSRDVWPTSSGNIQKVEYCRVI